jgi:hypothetical protein
MTGTASKIDQSYSHPTRSFMSPKLQRDDNSSLVKVVKTDKTKGVKTTKHGNSKNITFDDTKS